VLMYLNGEYRRGSLTVGSEDECRRGGRAAVVERRGSATPGRGSSTVHLGSTR
jgi:hypothetical protein